MERLRIEDLNRLGLFVNTGFNGFNVLWIGGFDKENRDLQNFKAHNHTFFEIHFAINGSLAYNFDGETVEISENQFLIIPPKCAHSIVKTSPDFRKITISFEVDPCTDFFDTVIKKSKISQPIPTDVFDSLAFIIRHTHNKADFIDVIIKNRLYEIIALIADCSSGRGNRRATGSSDIRLETAKRYVEDNPHSFFTCDDVAYYCNISVKQLGRLFKENEGCSLLEYIHKRKIEASKQMIRESDDKFDAISLSLGFSSVNYFGKFFLKYTGMTPGEYRKIAEKPHSKTLPKQSEQDT